jgi:hypothetical protein
MDRVEQQGQLHLVLADDGGEWVGLAHDYIFASAAACADLSFP